MNRFLKITATIITILAGLAAIVGFYFQIVSHDPEIEIKSITSDKLTDLPAVDGLKAQFIYKDSIVNSLWKLNYIISNSGDELIIGQGNKKNIIKEQLTFSLPKNFKILDLSFANESFPFEKNSSINQFSINFLQWRPNESFDVIIYAEQTDDSALPSLTSEEREIINGAIEYTSLQKVKEEKQPIFEYLPKAFQKALWWLGIIVFGLVVIVLPIVWLNDFIKLIKYKKWYKSEHWMYEKWIEKQISEGKISLYHKPQQLPENLWNDYPYPKPVFPDNEFGNLTLGAIIVLIFTLIPLLLMIKI